MPAILPDLAQASREQLLAHIAALQAAPPRAITCKVSAKGAMSIYGFGQFPFTFYASQWERFREAVPQINAFFEAHKAQFVRKA